VDTAEFVFATDLRLRVSGLAAAVRHARREYGPAEVHDVGRVSLDVTFGTIGGRSVGARVEDADRPPGRGGHKTVGWRVDAGDPDSAPLVARIETSGWPPAFARSLVQGYVMEPLLSVAAARRGIVLLPGAGIVLDDGLVLLLGRSRAGKSTLAARAVTAGRMVLGDDQVLVGPGAAAWPFPRSLRFYPDLARTAPSSFAALRPRTRLSLRLRAGLARLSAGYVRPSLAVDAAELGLRWDLGARPIARLVLVERDADRSDLGTAPGSTHEAVEWAADLLREQRLRLGKLGGTRWREAIDRVADAERMLLERSFDGLPVHRLAIPAAWDAPTAVAASARWLGIDQGDGSGRPPR
jgi:hypothetical protein